MYFRLLTLRWRIKAQPYVHDLWKHPTKFWHWSSTWGWFAVLCLGGLAFIAMNEFAVGLILLFFSLLSLSSKLWHTGWRLSMKLTGTIGIIIIMGLFVVSVLTFMEDRPWSNLLVFWNRFFVLRPLSVAIGVPSYPPDFSRFPSTSIPIPSKKDSLVPPKIDHSTII